jgi:molybdate transport system substrate-binding protein
VTRPNPMPWLAVGSLVVLFVCSVLLYFESRAPQGAVNSRSVKIYCAAALRPAMLKIAERYANDTGERVEFEFGDSGKMLGQVTIRPGGDLFLPADDSYVRLAEEKGLVERTVPLCRMRAVVLLRPGNPYRVTGLDDLLKEGLKIGIANPDRAAIGKVVRDHLSKRGKWAALDAKIDVQHLNVTDAANAVQLGARDATFVWDAVAENYPELAAVRVPELDGATGRVEVAVLKQSSNLAGARRFARYIAASDRGLVVLRESGFSEVEAGRSWTAGDEP